MSRMSLSELTRLRAQNIHMRTRIAATSQRLGEIETRSRRPEIEGRVARLALEVELDAAAEVERLLKYSDEGVDAEIRRMQANYRPRRDPFTPPEEDTVVGDKNGSRIWGESIARMALEAEESGQPLIANRGNGRDRRRNPLKMAKSAVKRFNAERDVTRA